MTSNKPTRQTRRRIAYWTMILISIVLTWIIIPGDIGQNEQAAVMVIVPSLVAIIGAFIGGETYSDHSKRVHKDADSD